MSANTDSGGRTLTELLRMDEQTAKRELSYAEFQTWQSATDHHSRYQERKRDWRENDIAVTQSLIKTDVIDLATEVTLWGNDVYVYYDPEDQRLRDAIDDLGDSLGVDMDGVDEIEATADDVTPEDMDAVKSALAEFLCVSFVEWDGQLWADMDGETREQIREQIQQPYPDGWGLAGLMDALTEVINAVESNRNARLERVQKFRNPERRGNR